MHVYFGDLLNLIVSDNDTLLFAGTSLPSELSDLTKAPNLDVVTAWPTHIADATRLKVTWGDAVLRSQGRSLPITAPTFAAGPTYAASLKNHHAAIRAAVHSRKRATHETEAPPSQDPFKYFGLEAATATLNELKKARARLVREYHPDFVADRGLLIQKVAKEETQRIFSNFDAARAALAARRGRSK